MRKKPENKKPTGTKVVKTKKVPPKPRKRAPSKKATRKPLNKSKLTIKQEKFCHVYMETGNASEAYRQAYSCSQMKPETINRKAKELIDNGKVTARLQVLKEKLQEVSNVKKERLLYELEAITTSKITDYVEFDGYKVRFKSFDELTDQQVRAIESIKQNEKGEIELKLHGKSWSTDRIAKLLGYDAPKKTDFTSKGEKIESDRIIILPSNNRDHE